MHKIVFEEKCKCPVCSKVLQWSSIKKHMRIQHPKMTYDKKKIKSIVQDIRSISTKEGDGLSKEQLADLKKRLNVPDPKHFKH